MGTGRLLYFEKRIDIWVQTFSLRVQDMRYIIEAVNRIEEIRQEIRSLRKEMRRSLREQQSTAKVLYDILAPVTYKVSMDRQTWIDELKTHISHVATKENEDRLLEVLKESASRLQNGINVMEELIQRPVMNTFLLRVEARRARRLTERAIDAVEDFALLLESFQDEDSNSQPVSYSELVAHLNE